METICFCRSKFFSLDLTPLRRVLLYWSSVLPRLHFCAIVAKILKMTQPKLSPRDIWGTLIFGLAQDFESVRCMENSHAKNNFDFHRNSRSCNSCFDWCIGFLNCTGTSSQ